MALTCSKYNIDNPLTYRVIVVNKMPYHPKAYGKRSQHLIIHACEVFGSVTARYPK